MGDKIHITLAMRMNELELLYTTMDESNKYKVAREKSQSQKITFCMSPFLYSSKTDKTK